MELAGHLVRQQPNATLSRQVFYSYFYTPLGTRRLPLTAHRPPPTAAKAKALKYIAQNADEKLQKYLDRKTLKAATTPPPPQQSTNEAFAHQVYTLIHIAAKSDVKYERHRQCHSTTTRAQFHNSQLSSLKLFLSYHRSAFCSY